LGAYLATRDVADGENPLVAARDRFKQQLEMTRLALSETEKFCQLSFGADANWEAIATETIAR